MKKFYSLPMAGKVIAGAGSIEEIPGVLKSLSAGKDVLLVTDGGIKAAGLADQVCSILETEGVSPVVLDSVPPEPAVEDVAALAASIKGEEFSLVLGLGGGSVLDTAKLLSALQVKNPALTDLVKGKPLENRGIPTVMIPTTAGTGSEATPNAIVAVPEEKRKIGIVSELFIPGYIILDPVMTLSLPAHITAATGVDALCHAIECFFSNKANPLSDALALDSLELIFKNLPVVYKEPSNIKARENMLLASFYAGMCIASSGTTAVHALSYPLGGIYHIPHGVSNAILLSPVLKYNRDAIIPELTRIAKAMDIHTESLSPGQTADQVISVIDDIIETVNIPKKLALLGIDSPDIEALTESASGVTRLLNNNPKELSKKDIKEIYESII